MPKRIVAEVSDTAYSKLLKRKAEDGFEDSDWGDWLKFLVHGVDLNPTITQQIHRGTRELLPMWMKSFAENLPLIREGKTLRELIPEGEPQGRAIVIGRGPSVFRNKHLELLKRSDYEGVTISTDGMLIECLKEGIVPDYVVSVDGSPVCEKWYNDPLVKEHGQKITSVLCTQVSPKVTKLVIDAGFRGPYWFVPTSDRVTDKDSITKLQLLMTCSERNPDGQISMDCGGNVGVASWTFVWNILKRKEICLIGFDFGYPEDIPLEESYYWSKTESHIGSLHAKTFYEKIFHPYFKTFSWIDPAFKSYRQGFFDMLMAVPDWVKTVNCTESGTLFCDPYLKCMYFREWLEGSS
ncbi:MAG: DUF115 domain-containing protein [Desulfobacterales bacterium]|nr:DUF115 domain-containing protein [Desulfobacterales bacterium]